MGIETSAFARQFNQRWYHNRRIVRIFTRHGRRIRGFRTVRMNLRPGNNSRLIVKEDARTEIGLIAKNITIDDRCRGLVSIDFDWRLVSIDTAANRRCVILYLTIGKCHAAIVLIRDGSAKAGLDRMGQFHGTGVGDIAAERTVVKRQITVQGRKHRTACRRHIQLTVRPLGFIAKLIAADARQAAVGLIILKDTILKRRIAVQFTEHRAAVTAVTPGFQHLIIRVIRRRT